MSLAVILTISCVLAAITLGVYSIFLFILLQSGGRGIKVLFDRFFGGGKQKQQEIQTQSVSSRSQPSVSSGDVLRRRAQELDFNPAGSSAQSQAGAVFSAQSAMPQQASLRSRDPLQLPQNPSQTQSGFGPSMPKLSSARPFQAGSGIGPAPRGGTPPPIPPQQAPGQFGRSLPPLGGPPPPPGQFGQQGGQFPAQPQQPGVPQQPGGLGEYRPGLRSQPGRSSDTQDTSGLRRRRDDRRSDDQEIYDDSDDGILGDLGGILNL